MTAGAILQHVIVWLPLVIAGLLLVRAGWRGRRINDHPICRRCRFDLVGLGEVGSHPDRCPECGTDLTGTTRRARRAVIDGERRRRWRALTLGLLLLLAGLGTGFWLTYKPLAKFPWTTWAPDWVLAEMIDSPNTAQSDMVAREMLQRIQRDDLSASAVRRATTKILVLQADLNTPWRPVLGTLIEASRAKGTLSDELWQAYAANAIVINVEVPPVIGEGARVQYTARTTYRVGGWIGKPGPQRMSLSAQVVGRRQTLGQLSRSREFARYLSTRIEASRTSESGSRLDFRSPAPGAHEGTIEFDVGVFNTEDVDESRNPTSFISRQTVAVPFVLHVIDPNTYQVSQKTPPELRDAMHKGFTIDAARLGRSTFNLEMTVTLWAQRPPMDYAFTVVLRTARGDLPLGQMAGRAGSQDIHAVSVERPPPGLSAGDVATIVLKPDTAAARSKPEIREIWGEEIILENVPITVEAE